MYNRRQMQLFEMAQFEAQCSTGEVHLGRDLNQSPECDPLQRHRVATPQRVQIDAVAVIGANHGQTG